MLLKLNQTKPKFVVKVKIYLSCHVVTLIHLSKHRLEVAFWSLSLSFVGIFAYGTREQILHPINVMSVVWYRRALYSYKFSKEQNKIGKNIILLYFSFSFITGIYTNALSLSQILFIKATFGLTLINISCFVYFPFETKVSYGGQEVILLLKYVSTSKR